jgi:hypothetical protein
MNIKVLHSKRSVVLTETEPDVRHYARVAYIKVTIWSLTMSGTTGEVVSRMSQLAWLVVTRTV